MQQRGLNDWTTLYYAVSLDDGEAVELLIAHGADIAARTRIDDCATRLQLAESCSCNLEISLFRAITRRLLVRRFASHLSTAMVVCDIFYQLAFAK